MKTGKYRPLHVLLAGSSSETLTLAFTQIDGLVGGLPPSARRYRAWWANEKGGRHVQATAWLAAGYAVVEVDLLFERVTYGRR